MPGRDDQSRFTTGPPVAKAVKMAQNSRPDAATPPNSLMVGRTANLLRRVRDATVAMQLESILTPARTLCGAPGTSKKRVLENLAQFIAENLPDTEADDLFASLLARERLGSTGLGEGIAIPHCRLKSVNTAIGCLVTLEQPIEFESVDDKPVDVLFVLLVPEAATQEHLNVLAALAERFSNPVYCQALRSARSDEELYRVAIS